MGSTTGIDLAIPFTNPITRETFRCVQSSPDSFSVEWQVPPQAGVYLEHVHALQDEIIYVKQGEVVIIMNGQSRSAAAGEVVRVPKGIRHYNYNARTDMLVCVLEYQPALDQYRFFQCLAGLMQDGEVDAKGQVSIPKMLYFARRMRSRDPLRPARIPEPIFKLLLWVFFIFGAIAGWERQYRQYTGETNV